MEFIHDTYAPNETIAAIATPPGDGGVAIIRIAGESAVQVANQIFSGDVPSYATHTAHYGLIVDKSGKRIDDVLLLPMLGKRSYCGEDTIEIMCHGGSLIARRVLQLALDHGARAARPGEFTFKAFMNGRLDLTQAESVQQLIAARSERSLDVSTQQLQGRLSQEISRFQKTLGEIAAILEAWVDFPDEDLEFRSFEDVIADIQSTKDAMQHLADTFSRGRVIHEGISVCLCGAPNVGKSSIMNALLGKERAIVSETPGTTRDVLEDFARLNNLTIRLTDTAGVRNASESIEAEGIRRTHHEIKDADVVLFVADLTRGLTDDCRTLLAELPVSKTIAVWNKSDLGDKQEAIPFQESVVLSAKNTDGFDALEQAIDRIVWNGSEPSKEELVLTNVRHKDALLTSIVGLDKVIEGLKTGISPEFVAFDMRHALKNLGKIIGTDVTEDILSAIFSQFCIGK